MDRITSAPRCTASVLMKDGANVFEDVEAPFEPERWRVIKELFAAIGAAREEYDWWRACAGLWLEDVGEDIIIDRGLPLGAFGPGEGDPVRENGLLRRDPALDAILQRLLEKSKWKRVNFWHEATSSQGPPALSWQLSTILLVLECEFQCEKVALCLQPGIEERIALC